ncbi:MAG: DUF2779 domain-containing protein [Gammaproteobacteria bacterium]|nr:DUF2779 domain-containing protein [Gammaproteobacteria bacterium]MYD80930.1 DUF2779 domain-containing protein [Gammaproteobacteria bacterium]
MMNADKPSQQPYLSKSRFMSGLQCELRLWYEVFNRDLMEDPDAVAQHRFDTGTEVGELAQKRYPGGRLIGHDHLNFREAYRETKELVNDPNLPALFEPAFQHKRVRCRIDILQRLPEGGWRVIEVKSATKLKDEYINDIALQCWVLKGANIDVRDACVLTLNPDYIRGKRLNVQKLFQEHPALEQVGRSAQYINEEVAAMKHMLSKAGAPDIAMGAHCTEPYKCPFYEHCSSDLPKLDHPVTEFYRFYRLDAEELAHRGIEEIRDVPADYQLSEINEAIRKSVLKGKAQGRRRNELIDRISGLRKPVRHLDFETLNPGIPVFEGTKPYQQVPFMFSMHTETRSGSLLHDDYLHEEYTDPRRFVAERLIESAGERGSICMYSSFERILIQNLANEFLDLEGDLQRILGRLVDIVPFVRDHYYHPEFRGSFSLKSVYPVLGRSDYSDLEIAEGSIASIVYLHALNFDDSEERERIFRNLKEYCKRDTLATHEILTRLRRHVGL